jgi:hypothetical protein
MMSNEKQHETNDNKSEQLTTHNKSEQFITNQQQQIRTTHKPINNNKSKQ